MADISYSTHNTTGAYFPLGPLKLPLIHTSVPKAPLATEMWWFCKVLLFSSHNQIADKKYLRCGRIYSGSHAEEIWLSITAKTWRLLWFVAGM